MTSRRPRKISCSLSDIGKRMNKEKSRRRHQAPASHTTPASPPAQAPPLPVSDENEDDLFIKAMVDVIPLPPDNHWQPPEKKPRGQRAHDPAPSAGANDEADPWEAGIDELHRLVEAGEGFRVADTPEYMESAGPGVDRNLVRRLHQGRYAVQGHVDLHGLTSAEAQEVLTRFIQNALAAGKRMVLVIHGRGLTSPGEPVLKNMVFAWLTRGPFRRHILAFTSARAVDGGAGATYILLRKHPSSKKRKRSSGQ
jgi:DNA-nicking Smr family endonuclease